MGLRYISPTLAAYVGEEVLVRYDPRDLAEVRVFYREGFLCRAICQELAGETVSLKDIVRARNSHRQQLRRSIQDRQRAVESLLGARRWELPQEEAPAVKGKRPRAKAPKLKRYRND
jgi:putative transposase